MKRINRKIIIVLSVIFILVLAIFLIWFFIYQGQGSIVVSENNTEPMKLRVAYMEVETNLQFFVALEKGFFKDLNLEVEAIPMAGGAVILPALASGDIDIGRSSPIAIIQAHDRGFDFRLLSPGGLMDYTKNVNLYKLLGQIDSEINSPKDFEGKTVAINTLASILELAMKSWADKNNVDISKVNLVEIPFSQMASALESKQIDVAFIGEPSLSILLENKKAKVLEDKPFINISERFMIGGYFAKESWIDNNPEQAEAFTRAINKANEYILENPAEVAGILAKYTKLTEEIIGQVKLPIFAEEIKKDDLQSQIDACYKYGFISKIFDAEEIVADNIDFVE